MTSSGQYHSKNVKLPEEIFRLYLIEAQEHKALIDEASDKQKGVIATAIQNNLHDAMSKDSMKDFVADLTRSGNTAFMDND